MTELGKKKKERRREPMTACADGSVIDKQCEPVALAALLGTKAQLTAAAEKLVKNCIKNYGQSVLNISSRCMTV